MPTDRFIGMDWGAEPSRTAIIVRDPDGRYREATEDEIKRFHKQEAWFNMKERLSNEG